MRPLITLAALIVSIAVAGTALAGGHSNSNGNSNSSSSSSVSLVVVTAAASNNIPPGAVPFGSVVSYNVSTSATAYPWVETDCYQGKTLVFAQTQGFFSSYYTTPNYQLGPTPAWSGGAATCTATLFSYELAKRQNLASTSYDVG